jgi:GNAT superfamily N-acetyltransferase
VTRTIVVRPARIEDAADIWPLVRDFATSFTAERAAFDSVIPGVVDHPDSLLLVAQRPDRPDLVGYLLAHRHAAFHDNAPVVWVEEIMVAEADRRIGVGRALMMRAERWGRDSGATLVALATRRAADFYLRLGFQESATYFRKLVGADADDGPSS